MIGHPIRLFFRSIQARPLLLCDDFVVRKYHTNTRDARARARSRTQTSTTTSSTSSSSSSKSRSSVRFAPHLEHPTILFTNNHLLAVHKPAGWHSVPNVPKNKVVLQLDNEYFEKCLLTYCQQQHWGGGSQSQFLLPLHRLDQPCTGVLLLGKSSKAARRIQSKWQLAQKTYYCVVHQENIPNLIAASTREMAMTDVGNDSTVHESNQFNSKSATPSVQNLPDDASEYQLSGILLPHSKEEKTVRMVRVQSSNSNGILSNDTMASSGGKGQFCSITWKMVLQVSSSFAVLQVRTNQGRRHMIRALLGSIGSCPVAGDLRYASSSSSSLTRTATTTLKNTPLSDQSVALHAAQIILPPTLQLGQPMPPPPQLLLQREQDDDDNNNTNDKAPISLAGLAITAPIPRQWQEFFGIERSSLP
ncbi:hypothetical protein ACA910_002335 [Epithemia clementina (nom. ined.)]